MERWRIYPQFKRIWIDTSYLQGARNVIQSKERDSDLNATMDFQTNTKAEASIGSSNKSSKAAKKLNPFVSKKDKHLQSKTGVLTSKAKDDGSVIQKQLRH